MNTKTLIIGVVLSFSVYAANAWQPAPVGDYLRIIYDVSLPSPFGAVTVNVTDDDDSIRSIVVKSEISQLNLSKKELKRFGKVPLEFIRVGHVGLNGEVEPASFSICFEFGEFKRYSVGGREKMGQDKAEMKISSDGHEIRMYDVRENTRSINCEFLWK